MVKRLRRRACIGPLPSAAADPRNLGTRQTGDCGQVASQGLSDLLAMAITLSWTAQDERRNTRPDPSIEPRQPALACTSCPRRTAQAWHRGQSATVARYLPRRPKAPSPTWRSFLPSDMTVIVAVDMFVVPTATFRMLYAVIVLDHHRRSVVHSRSPETRRKFGSRSKSPRPGHGTLLSAPRPRHVIWPLLPGSCSSDGH
jgi:hypothetical protein